ncbi:MAG TPA: DNA polymerase III subunit delta [Gemmatimonadales bacterium]|jgi:DNA polymerase-3 subunit delta|nr:DNA polymerase III subunit delta [Gemmatimonadales bacterium]
MATRLTPDRLRAALDKGTIAPAYYIHGGEALLKHQAVADIMERALDPGTRDFNLDLLSAQQVEPGALAAACATLPMMAERRVVVLRDVESWKRKSKAKLPAVAYLEHPAVETVLVIVQGNDDDPDEDIARHCATVDCSPLTGEALEAWLAQQLATTDMHLSSDAREHLLRATGGDLGLLSAELQKLGGLTVIGEIDRETVGNLVGVRFGETVDDWRDAVLRDDTARALSLVPRLLETSGTSGVRLVTLLGSSLLLLAWARTTAEERRLRDRALAEAVKRLCFTARPGVGSYDPAARLIAEVAGRWPIARTRAAIAATLAADVALKNTTISDEAGIVTDLVLTLAASRIQKAA